MAHFLHCEDGVITMGILRKESVWGRDGWAAKLGAMLNRP